MSHMRQYVGRLVVQVSTIVLVAMVALSVHGLTTMSAAAQPSPTPSIKITDPLDGAVVPVLVNVQGTTGGTPIPAGYHLWTAVQIQGGIWPQRESIPFGFTWDADVVIADDNPAHCGKRFTIMAVLLDDAGNTDWDKYVKDGGATGDFPPRLSMPPGTVGLDKITVVLKHDKCP